MSLIDARDRFQARRDAADRESALLEKHRHVDGTFGERERRAAEDGLLVIEAEELTLAEVFEQMNELGELDDAQTILDSPTIDTYTGTPEERAAQERKDQLNDLIRRAGLDMDAIPEKTAGEIYAGLEREQMRKEVVADYNRRNLPEFVQEHTLPVARTVAEQEVNNAITQIIEARGDTVSDYIGGYGVDHIAGWAREQQQAGNLASAVKEEVTRSREEREDREATEREFQIISLGELTDDVWDAALEEDRLRAQQSIRKLRPTNYVNLKETNAFMRGDLKDAFPSVKFSVRGDSYAGGASTRVSYVDGPPLADAEAVSKAYSGATFDGMTDLKSYVSTAGFDDDGIPQSTHYAADFVFVSREFSEETTRDAHAFLVQAFAAEGKTFDPNERNTPHEIPQAMYQRATEENGGKRYGSFSLGRGGDQYAGELVAMASTLIANEKWAARTV